MLPYCHYEHYFRYCQLAASFSPFLTPFSHYAARHADATPMPTPLFLQILCFIAAAASAAADYFRHFDIAARAFTPIAVTLMTIYIDSRAIAIR
jgi:hypothetical protein